MFTALTAAVYAVRFARVLRLYPAAHYPLPLLLIAPLLPSREATLWVPELESQFAVLDPTARRELTTDVIRSLPGLLRGAAERAVLRAVRRQLGPINAALRSPAPIWPADERQWYRLKAHCSTLRLSARLLDHFVSEPRHPELVSRAKWLATRCEDFLVEQTQLRPAAPHRRCTAQEAALLLEIAHIALMVNELIDRELARGDR
ncbi:hypothetical protein LZG04_00240 [Saccharothrix sp. S26]|uniref:hypothetical protein n=1 Tax=Saccharothrix sp. S26 TaxID=2907215 RepID=UPI001F2978C8|nr:hypothetical protein [Saccharothrix sp. S26]MCE6993245.1 hypothetical protein [Saccharothrix sp. S26]